MTGEAKGPTEKWINDKGAKYAYGYDKGNKFSRESGVSGIPHVVIVDPLGKVLYNGGAGGYSEEILKQAVSGALKKPLWELPKEFSKVRAGILKDDLAAALRELDVLAKSDKASQEIEPMKASLLSMIEGRLAAAQAAAAAGDWTTAKSTFERLAKAAAGTPAEKASKEALQELAKNPAAQKAIKAQKALDTILAMPAKKQKDLEARAVALRDFIKKNEGTHAAKKAQALLAGSRGE